MVTLRKITNANDEEFGKLMQLYTEAFPLEERRDEEQLKKMLIDEPRMSFNAVQCDGKLAGLFVYWDFGTFYYLEHLAIYAEMRNAKIGQQTLDWMKENLDGLRILEAEPAETDIATRRVCYYERNGYTVYEKEYLQPAYRAGGDGCRLWVMCNREDTALNEKLEQLKEAVYYRGRRS